MNKRHWNSVTMGGSIKDEVIYSWLDEAYNLVVDGLTEKKRQELGI